MRIRQEITDIEDWGARDKDPRADEIRKQVARLKEKALAAGGLFVLGTERHESRRIDTSCAAAPAVRATRVIPSSSCRWKTT